MTRREAVAALIVLPVALTALPKPKPMGSIAQLVLRVSASIAEFEKSMAGLEKSLARAGKKIKRLKRDARRLGVVA